MCLIYEHLMYKHQNPASQLWKLVSSSSTSFTHSVSLLHTTLALSFLFISSPYNFFSLNRYLSCVPSTILNPRESRMKSIKSLSSRIIHSRDCSDSFHALNVLNIFLCVWNMCVWRVVCLGGGVSGGWCVWSVCVWGVVCLECLWGVVWGRLSSCSRSTYWNAKVPALAHLCPSSVEGKVRLLAYLEDSENISIHV